MQIFLIQGRHFSVLSDRFLRSIRHERFPQLRVIPFRRKRDSRELILQAAEEIVAKRGPAHLTLETAANEAKVSKGGLFYHFRSKEALLEAMIRRSMELLESEHLKFAESLTGERNGKMKANIIGTLRHLEGQRPVLTAVIAAIANDPKLVEPMRESIRKEFQELSKELTPADRRYRHSLSRFAGIIAHGTAQPFVSDAQPDS